MYQDLRQYYQWLQNYIQAQDKRIAQLEKSVKQMAEELQQIKAKPSIHVDTIEYKFDQLKVETVQGTLNIGLNPTDLQGIEDLAIDNQTENNHLPPKAQMQRSIEIEDQILRYLETDLPKIIFETQNSLMIEPNEAYLSFIKEDIKKQLPNRIDFHLRNLTAEERSAENQSAAIENVVTRIKQEIQNGVLAFFQHLPENVKGMKQE